MAAGHSSHQPNRNQEPSDDLARLKREGFTNLMKAFDEHAKMLNMKVVDDRQMEHLVTEWEEDVRHFLLNEIDSESDIAPSECTNRFAQMAEDDCSYFVLVITETIEESNPLFIDQDSELLIPLQAGACAGQIVMIPKEAKPQRKEGWNSFSAGIGESDDEDTEPLRCRFFIDPMSLRREIIHFSENPEEPGLVAMLFRGAIEDDRFEDLTITQVDRGQHYPHSDNAWILHIVGENGERLLFELGINQTDNSVATYGPIDLLDLKSKKAQDISEQSSPSNAQNRKDVLHSLKNRGFKPLEWENEVERREVCAHFAGDMRDIFDDLGVPSELKVHIVEVLELIQPHKTDKPALIEVALRNESGDRHYLPFGHKGLMIESSDALSLFFIGVCDKNDDGRFTYFPAMLGLPPQQGLSVLMPYLRDAHQPGGLLAPRLHGAVGAALGYDEREYAGKQFINSIEPLTSNWKVAGDDEIDPDVDFIESGEESTEFISDQNFPLRDLLALCFHKRGAHILHLHQDDCGIVSLNEDIVVRHFLPEFEDI